MASTDSLDLCQHSDVFIVIYFRPFFNPTNSSDYYQMDLCLSILPIWFVNALLIDHEPY